LRILLVDDSSEIRSAVAAMLTTAGHEVVAQADDGDRGVAQAIGHQPDLVICDWRMPVVDGVEATRRIREACPSVAVVAFASTNDPTVRDAFLPAGAAAFVDKRDVRGLLAAVRAVERARET